MFIVVFVDVHLRLILVGVSRLAFQANCGSKQTQGYLAWPLSPWFCQHHKMTLLYRWRHCPCFEISVVLLMIYNKVIQNKIRILNTFYCRRFDG